MGGVGWEVGGEGDGGRGGNARAGRGRGRGIEIGGDRRRRKSGK